ncbi:hypothetical protein IID24_04390 [Patescibacteria group bacterium]|nr:hypothetical protein [Patescibacteria group bacterium]
MASVKTNTTIQQYQSFVHEVYGLNNDRDWTTWDMLTNIQRYILRALKGIRKHDREKIRINLLIAQSWYMSFMNQLHIDVEEKVWERFPYACSYCAFAPCQCKEKKVQKRHKLTSDKKKRPKTFAHFQEMFRNIYPPEKRTIEDAGIHLAEEMGELSEATLRYRGLHQDKDFQTIAQEAGDFFSCLMGVFNSLDIDVTKELSKIFSHNCHICKQAPCECSFDSVLNFKS